MIQPPIGLVFDPYCQCPPLHREVTKQGRCFRPMRTVGDLFAIDSMLYVFLRFRRHEGTSRFMTAQEV
jgi:hypothetical protein